MQAVVADAALNLGLAASCWEAHIKLLLLKWALILLLLEWVCLQSIELIFLPSPAAAAAAAKSLQSCPTLCNPIDSSPSGSTVPGILQARTLERVAISFSDAWKWKLKVKLLSRVWLLVTPWTAAYQAPPSMGFSRQEYWSGVPALIKDFLFQINILKQQRHLPSLGTEHLYNLSELVFSY